jgi:hypothetical protein
MPQVPRQEIVHTVFGGDRHMDGIDPGAVV